MKLAFCLFKYFPYGGLQRDFLRIAKLCHARGHEIHVLTMQWEGEQIPELHLHLFPPRGMQNHTRIRRFISQALAFAQEQNFDLMIGFNKMPGLDLYYAADVCFQSRLKSKLHAWLPRYRQLLALENAVFASGAKTKIMLISPLQQPFFTGYYKTEANRFHLLPPGIDKKRLSVPNATTMRQTIRLQHGLSDQDKLLILAGSGFKTKGLDRAILGLAHLPPSLRQQSHLFVLGQDHPASFISLAKRLGVIQQVHFLGGRNDIANFLFAADLLVHPAYHENTGTVLLEAMTCGLPVLTVETCGYAHYVREAGAGHVLSSPFQQNEFNVALETMLSSKNSDRWRERGREFIRRTDVESMPEKAVNLIEEVGLQRHAFHS